MFLVIFRFKQNFVTYDKSDRVNKRKEINIVPVPLLLSSICSTKLSSSSVDLALVETLTLIKGFRLKEFGGKLIFS